MVTEGKDLTSMNKKIILCVLIAMSISQVINAGSSRKVKMWGSTTLNGGYKSNIYRQPEVMDTGTGKYNPVQGDAVISAESWVYITYKANRTNKFQFSLNGDYDLFPRYTQANGGGFQGGIEYRYKPVKSFNLKLVGDAGYTRRLSFVEAEGGEFGLYKYWTYSSGPKIELMHSKSFSLGAEYLFTYKDYEGSDSGQSFDNFQHNVNLCLSPRFGNKLNNIIIIDGSYIFKKYRDRLSYDDDGNQIPDYPLRKYHYYTLILGYEHDFGTVAWNFKERPRFLVDAFEDFYTYFENKISSGLKFHFSKGPDISVNGAWRYRYYIVHEAKRPGINPNLVMRYVNFDAGIKQKLWKKIFLTAEYDLQVRKTNTGYLSYVTYRDYTVHTVKVGVRVEW